MSYNKSYGGQFMGLTPQAKMKEVPTPVIEKQKSKKSASKVIFSISELREVNLPELEKGDRYFICTIIFDNNDVKASMEKSNHNSKLLLGKFLHQSYSLVFDDEIVLSIPNGANFARCYVSCVTVKEEAGKRNIKLEGLGYTDPFPVQEVKVYAYANCKLNTAIGADETSAVIKMCVKCVESDHRSTVKSCQPYNVLEEVKKKYEASD